ncbi:MAG: 3-deoxy-7-phosphoheptulonate synthase [Ignavibacteriales bacterium]|nr:3-deoxy-7-phosphoheptulonate synthase [Ignavibacteriales bacterium]
MILVMDKSATEADVKKVVSLIEGLGFQPHVSKGSERTIIGVIGDERKIKRDQLALLPHVENVIPILRPYKLASRDFKSENTIVDVAGVKIGGKEIAVIAGPCSVESEEQIYQTARAVKAAGAKLLRGGAFKPRTSPYTFQGMEEEGLKLLAKTREMTGLGIVSEVMDANDVDMLNDYTDLIQVGARNMQNTKLLKRLAQIKKPVLLKRNFSATLSEFLMSAEYLLSGGNDQVILCERGIRTFVDYTRNTLDLNIIPAVKQLSHLPIIVDPSHGTGRYDFVLPMSRAAIAAGADGLLIEVHPDPAQAFSDGEQSLTPAAFQLLMKEIKALAGVMGREV